MSQILVKEHKYYYFYKVTNVINNHFYYGIHCTDNLNDGYMGSGVLLHKAFKKHGIENFNKEIIKYFETWQDALEYERNIVNESLIKDPNCYNIARGGKGFAENNVIVFDPSQNKNIMISNTDPRFISGELKPYDYGKIMVKDKDGNKFRVYPTDPRYISGEVIPLAKGVKKSLTHRQKLSEASKKLVANKTHNWTNSCFIHKMENNQKINKRIQLDELQKYLNDGWIKSNTSNEPEKRWINKNGEDLLVNRNQIKLYLENGWKTGHVNKNKSRNCGENNPNYGKHQKQIYFIEDDGNIINKQVDISLVEDYISNGWKLGRKRKIKNSTDF